MRVLLEHYIQKLSAKPRVIFLIDGLGALNSFILLFFVLRNYHEYIGLPQQILTYLSVFALCLFVFSASCYFFLKSHWSFFIKLLSFGNIAYCIFSILILIYFYQNITFIGVTYFIIEKAIVLGLAFFELKLSASVDNGIFNNT